MSDASAAKIRQLSCARRGCGKIFPTGAAGRIPKRFRKISGRKRRAALFEAEEEADLAVAPFIERLMGRTGGRR